MYNETLPKGGERYLKPCGKKLPSKTKMITRNYTKERLWSLPKDDAQLILVIFYWKEPLDALNEMPLNSNAIGHSEGDELSIVEVEEWICEHEHDGAECENV